MAATPINDDGRSVTYQLDDGSTVQVAKDAALRMGAPMMNAGGASPAGQQNIIVTSAPQGIMGALATMPNRDQSPPPPKPPIETPPAPRQSAPIPGVPSGLDPIAAVGRLPQPTSPKQQRVANGANSVGEIANAPSTQPPIAPIESPTGTQPVAPKAAPAPTPGIFGSVVDEHRQGESDVERALRERATAEQAGNLSIVEELKRRNEALEKDRQLQAIDQQKAADEIFRRSKAIDASIADYGKTKINPNQLWDSLGTVGKAGLIFSQIITGLGQALKHEGDKNPAIDMWLKQVSQNINLQMDARTQKGEQIGQQKSALDMFKDQAQTKLGLHSLAMAAETDRSAKMLEQIAAQTKSDTVRANALEAMGQLREQSANFKGEWAKAEFSADMEIKKLQNQQRHERQEEAIGWSNVAQRKYEFGETQKMEQKKLDIEAGKVAATGNLAAAKVMRENGVAGVSNKDGTPFVAQGTPESVEKDVRQPTIAAQQLVGMLDEARRIRTGFSTGVGNSDEWQKLQAIWSANKGIAKNLLQLGALSASDYDLLNGFLGAKDPTQFRDPGAGLEQARKNIITITNKNLKGHGLEGEWDIPDMQAAAPTEAPGDAAQRDVIAGPKVLDLANDALQNKIDANRGRNPVQRGIEQATDVAGGAKPQAAIEPITRSIAKTLDTYAAALDNPNLDAKMRDQVLSNLLEAANKSASPAIRERAKQILQKTSDAGLSSVNTDAGAP